METKKGHKWTQEMLLERKQPGYSQADLAKISGFHQRTIGRVANRLINKNGSFTVDEAMMILNNIKPTPGNPNGWKRTKGAKYEKR